MDKIKGPRFRIYYSDREPYSGDPFLAPQTGVQAIAQEDGGANSGYKVLRGKDAWYWASAAGWHGDSTEIVLSDTSILGWRGCDESGMWDYLMMYRGPKAVLFGRMAQDDEYWNIFRRAKEEGLG